MTKLTRKQNEGRAWRYMAVMPVTQEGKQKDHVLKPIQAKLVSGSINYINKISVWNIN